MWLFLSSFYMHDDAKYEWLVLIMVSQIPRIYSTYTNHKFQYDMKSSYRKHITGFVYELLTIFQLFLKDCSPDIV